MKLVVLGANGRTGKLVVQEALEMGETVTAVVRSEAKKLDIEHNRLQTIVGDPCDPTFLAKVFTGQDAVVSTLGGRSPTKKATSVYWKSAEAIVTAAKASGLKKAVVTSSALLFPSKRLIDKLLVGLVSNVVRSATRMEQILSQSKLDVIVARCGFLTNEEERGYRAELESLPIQGSSIARKGVAEFLIDKVREESSGNQIYGVSHPI